MINEKQTDIDLDIRNRLNDYQTTGNDTVFYLNVYEHIKGEMMESHFTRGRPEILARSFIDYSKDCEIFTKVILDTAFNILINNPELKQSFIKYLNETKQ